MKNFNKLEDFDFDHINPYFLEKVDLKNPSKCDGEIKVEVILNAEPYFGGVDYNILVSCQCDKCKTIYDDDKDFPTSENISEWVTKRL